MPGSGFGSIMDASRPMLVWKSALSALFQVPSRQMIRLAILAPQMGRVVSAGSMHRFSACGAPHAGPECWTRLKAVDRLGMKRLQVADIPQKLSIYLTPVLK